MTAQPLRREFQVSLMTEKDKSELAPPLQGWGKMLGRALVEGSVPGELEGFGPAARREATHFIAQVASKRKPGHAAVAMETFTHPSGKRLMRLAILNDDMPFLVDSVAAIVARHGLVTLRLLHPLIPVERSNDGNLVALGKSGLRESLIYLEAERGDARTRATILHDLRISLAAVRAAVKDWPTMTAHLAHSAVIAEQSETGAFLAWVATGNFTLLGSAIYEGKQAQSGALGIAAKAGDDLLSPEARRRALDWFRAQRGDILIVKSNLISPVHRSVPLDLIILPTGPRKRVSGIAIHVGLWTSAALTAAADSVPILRTRLATLQAKFHFDPSGHAGKGLAHALNTLPHDIAISISEADLERLTLAAMSIADRPRVELELVSAPLERHLFGFVWLPRDELSTYRRTAIADMIAGAANGQLLNWSVALEDSGTALLRYVIDVRAGHMVPDQAALEAQVEAMVRGWAAGVEQELASLVDAGQATRLTLRYASQCPQAYRDRTSFSQAARDIVHLHALADNQARGAQFYRLPGDADGSIRLKLYALAPIALSDAVPVLENFGLHVGDEVPTALVPSVPGSVVGHIHDFRVSVPGEAEAAWLLKSPAGVELAIASVLEGAAENDRFNALMIGAKLDARSVLLFRALFRYLRQTGMAYSLLIVVDALRKAPGVARALVDLLVARHDREAVSESHAKTAETAIEKGLVAISAIDEDRILRQFRAVILATVRTNMFAPAAREALAFKIDCAALSFLPAPVPWREIFVYSPRVEGIHLRAGPIARGGLRWSDRRDDFRTEVLGLMKAQRVKNAVIVPTGAKGGFYPKHLPDPADRAAWLAEGTEAYRIFIRTLLSVTDNLVDGKTVHPQDIICHDGDDPYFVVAADKGTATFSDIANAIALEQGFWLGDAFASGGSVGYDHKAMGITAKGAWVSVQRHFAERGVDVQKDAIRVAGCGDMSGDVFGNGMLLSKAIKLVAAFDHRHIFLDPDPVPAESWKERARLFALPRSSWDDYDKKLLSKGGGVFPRSAKTIRLTPQIRDMLDLKGSEVEPNLLITAILKARVDLMWFGGIGTYVKARSESHGEAGDRANDGVRINAEELRCTAMGEGANLGVTQAARIVFGLNGGRSNTDFIDNSAGVDCSDNEVNIKIALGRDVKTGKLSPSARNRLLARMTEDVGALVLEDNRLQTLALSIAERGGASEVPAQIRLIEHLETSGRLDRAVEGLASNDELFRRAAEGKGLTRPELAVLLSTAKLMLQDAIEATGLGTDPAALADLMQAFPLEMRQKRRAGIEGHQLRGAIIATKLANRIINRMGIIHPFELAEEEGRGLGAVAEAFLIAEQVYDIPTLWAELDRADISEAARLMLFEQVAVEMRAHMADVLRNSVASRSNDLAIAAYAPLVKRLSERREELLPAEARAQTGDYGQRLIAAGAPPKLAAQLVRLAQLDGAIGLAALSLRSKVDAIALTQGFTALGSALGLDWAQGTAMQLDPVDPWERLLVAGLARDFQAMRLEFLARIGGDSPAQSVSHWIDSHSAPVADFRRMIDRARTTAATPAMLAQIAGQARGLLNR
jgi:glutamate dehydrogenase